MASSDYRTYGWTYTILGLVLFGVGVGSALDPQSTRLYIGALLGGPLMAVRGIYFLHVYHRDRQPPPTKGSTDHLRSVMGLAEPRPAQTAANAEPETAGGVAALYAEDIRRGARPNEVTCEACGQEYVYFPARAAEAQAAAYGPEVASQMAAVAFVRECAVAPCPKCGWLQPDMIPIAREQDRVSVAMWAGIIACFLAAIFFFYVMSSVVVPAMNQPGLVDSTPYWLADATLFVVGGGLLFWGWRSGRRWDPNSQPQNERLAVARQVSLPRDVYAATLQARAPHWPPAGAGLPPEVR